MLSILRYYIRQLCVMKKLTFISLFLFVCLSSKGQENVPFAWLEGSWTGDGFGGTSEEVWSAPAADGTMMGSYRHFDSDGSLNFYEFWLLDSTGLVLKHFDRDFVGWEEKDEFLFFKMEELSEDKVALKGLVYEKISETEMKIYLEMNTKEGKKTEVFSMTKK